MTESIKQLSIFDLMINEHIEKIGIENELNKLSNEYCIDKYYQKVAFGRTLTLHEIECSLTRLDNYTDYITKVYEILEKYYDVIDEKNMITDFQTIGISKRENSIRIYQPRCQYSVWCISMIDEIFLQYAAV